ncbi:hypothetical protein ABZZ80_35365 [Streptomyces sp. NPDC006356]
MPGVRDQGGAGEVPDGLPDAGAGVVAGLGPDGDGDGDGVCVCVGSCRPAPALAAAVPRPSQGNAHDTPTCCPSTAHSVGFHSESPSRPSSREEQ